MNPSEAGPDAPSIRDPVEAMAEDFLERYRRGERPALTEFTERAPEHADEIRELFPALVLMERAGPDGTAPPSVAAPAAPLERLGDYRIIRVVGRGGMGIVYEAEQEALGRHVALKVLPGPAAGDSHALLRFRREARSAARLHHTNIVPVYDIGEREGVHYYAMQFIQGQALDEVIAELHGLRRLRTARGSADVTARPPEPGPAASLAGSLLSGQFRVEDLATVRVPPEGERSPRGSSQGDSGPSRPLSDSAPSVLTEHSDFSTKSDFQFYRSVARIGLQVADALAYAHGQRVLHRDIKPSNLLLDAHGTVWVTDFGLAKEEGDNLTRSGDVVGTLRYMAPERFNGVSEARSDVYGLGLTLYELLTLQPAFPETDRARLVQRITHQEPVAPRKLDPHVPRDLETILFKAIAKEPARRYATAEDMEEDLRRFLADRPIRARRTSTRERVWRWCRRNRGWAATIATVLCLLIISAVGGTLLSFHLQHALHDAQTANDEKTEQLRKANLERARALRSSGRVGQRFEALTLIREAAKIKITPELRDEAVAALVLPDVEVAREWEGHTEDTTEWTCDAEFHRYARISKGGEVTVCQLSDQGEDVIARMPKQAGDGPRYWGLHMSPDGRFLVQGHSSPQQSIAGGVRIWKLDGPEPTVHFNEPEGLHLFAIRFDADSRRLAIGHTNGTISIYDLERGVRTQRLTLGELPNSLAFHPRDGRLAVACKEAIRLFDIATERELFPALREAKYRNWSFGLAWHPSGRLVAAVSEHGKIHLWDTQTAVQIMPPLDGPGISVTFNPRGDRLLSAGWDGQAKLWDALTGRLLLTMPGRFESSGEGTQAQFSRDGSLIGVERSGTKLRLWRLADGRELRTIRRANAEREETIFAPVLDADGRILAAASNRGLGFFDLEIGRELAFVRFENNTVAVPRRFDRSGGWLTGGTREGMLWPARWDAARADLLHVGPPRTLAPVVDIGVDASLDGRFRAFPQRQHAMVLDRDRPGWHAVLGLQHDVRFCAVSPEGRWVATCTWHPDPDGQTRSVRIWEVQKDRGQHVLYLPVEAGANASFSPNGRWLVTSAHRLNCQVWDVETWRSVSRFKNYAFWSPDGRYLAVNDAPGALVLVEPETGKEVLRLIGPEARGIYGACMTPDGTRVITGLSDSSALQVWDLRMIRRQLRELGMDWEMREFPPVPDSEGPGPRLTVQVDPGDARQAVFENFRQDVAVFSLLLALQPINPEAYFHRGMAYGRLNQSQRAIDDHEKFLALTPMGDLRRPEVQRACARACNNLAWALSAKPSPQTGFPQALRLARKAVEFDADNFLYQNTLGVALYRMAEYDEAARCLEANQQRSGEHVAFDLYFLAMSQQRLGQPDEAIASFNRANAATLKFAALLSTGHQRELADFRAEVAGVLGIGR